MSDHSASVENLAGLDMEELFRLLVEDLPVDAFNTELLNGGELHLVTCPEGTHKRNTMHKADVFVPTGNFYLFFLLFLLLNKLLQIDNSDILRHHVSVGNDTQHTPVQKSSSRRVTKYPPPAL